MVLTFSEMLAVRRKIASIHANAVLILGQTRDQKKGD
jgi:hypothetical protein